MRAREVLVDSDSAITPWERLCPLMAVEEAVAGQRGYRLLF